MSRIYSRKSWGARYVDGVGNRPVGSLQKYLHHSVTKHLPANATLEQERVQCRVVESIGQQRFGRGISYTFLIFPSGRIHQGASVHRISYHSGGGRDGKPRNTLGVGICLVGNTDTNEMTPQQVAAVVWLLQEGVRRGWWQDPAITEAHRDFKSTACPGRHAYKRIDEINRRGRAAAAPPAERTWLDMATEKEVEAATERAIERVLSRRPSGPEGSREHRLRYHDKHSQMLYAAIAGLELPLVRAKVDAIADALAGRALDETAVAEHVAALIGPTLVDALTEAMADHPGVDPDAIAVATLSGLGRRLAIETEDS